MSRFSRRGFTVKELLVVALPFILLWVGVISLIVWVLVHFIKKFW